MINGELVVDNFAGGGGASTGIEMATGISVDIAINHDPEAIKMHKANHPSTKHYCESVWDVDPIEACNGHPVGLAWFSPDCKHFSKAKGGKPKDKNIRGLAWVALRWAGKVRPRVIMLENVGEFKTLKKQNEDCSIKHLTNECSYNETGCSDCKGKETIRVAVERLKPKKPITYKGTNRADCPNCGNTVRGIDKPFGNFCSKCGQAIEFK